MNKSTITPAFTLRERKAATTRLALLDAAIRRLGLEDFENIAVKELCSEVGISEPTFFHHFASKRELLMLEVGLWSVETRAAMEDAGHTAFSSLEVLFLRAARANRALPRLMPEVIAWQLRAPPSERPALPTKAECAHRFPGLWKDHSPASIPSLIETAVERAIRTGELPASTGKDGAVGIIVALFFGAHALRRGKRSIDAIYREGLRALWKGLGGRCDERKKHEISHSARSRGGSEVIRRRGDYAVDGGKCRGKSTRTSR
jgi:AcrR family transcriptional regulator